MSAETRLYTKEEALRVAEQIARRFGEPRPNLPKIVEFIVFGSTANGTKDTVGDLDISVMFEMSDDPKRNFGNFPDRLEEIEAELYRSGARLPHIDFLPLMVNVIWDAQIQQMYRQRLRDPNHVHNILSSFLRWDPKSGTFVKADRAYLDRYVPKS